MTCKRIRCEMFFTLVLATAQISGGQSTQESLLANADASFRNLTEAYEGLLDLDQDVAAETSHKRSLRHSPRSLAQSRQEQKHDTPSDVEALKAQESKAEAASTDLKETVDEAIHRVKDGVILKHDIAQKGVKVRIDNKKLRKLEKEVGRLSETRESLFSSLHQMLDSKIGLARKRLEKKEAVLQKSAELAKEWKTKSEELKAMSKEQIREKHAVKKALLEAEAEVAKAKERELELRRSFERKSKEVAEKVQSFEYAETRYKAQFAHEKLAKEAALAAKESLNELERTFDVESQKVEESVDIRKVQLSRKMHVIEEDKEKSTEELAHLKGQFAEWRADTYKEKQAIEKKRHEQQIASEELAEQKRHTRQAAKTKNHHFSTGGARGDWDSWGGAGVDSDIENTD